MRGRRRHWQILVGEEDLEAERKMEIPPSYHDQKTLGHRYSGDTRGQGLLYCAYGCNDAHAPLDGSRNQIEPGPIDEESEEDRIVR